MPRVGLILFFFWILGPIGCGTVPRIVILQDPLSAEEHLRLGVSYEARGEWDLAISEYQAALKKGGSASVIQGYLGNAYYSKKEFSSARTAYQKSLKENPQNAPVLNNLANLFLTQKQDGAPRDRDLQEAESLVREAIRIDPPRKGYYLDTLGSVYRERGEYDLALSAYEEAESLAASDPVLLEQLHENKKRVIELINGSRGQTGQD